MTICNVKGVPITDKHVKSAWATQKNKTDAPAIKLPSLLIYSPFNNRL